MNLSKKRPTLVSFYEIVVLYRKLFNMYEVMSNLNCDIVELNFIFLQLVKT